MVKDADIVGEAIAAVLPKYDRPWFRVPHLLKLNLILIVPLLSSAVAGYDGKEVPLFHIEPKLTTPRLDDERSASHYSVEELLQRP